MKEFLKSRISFHCEKWSSCSLWPNMFLNISAIDYFPQRYCAISVSDNHWCEHTREHILRFKAAQDIWTTLIPQVVFKILKMLHQNERGYLLSQKESCITNSETYKLNCLFHYLSTVRFSVKVKHLWRRARFKACLIHFVWQILPFSRHYGSPSKGLTRKKGRGWKVDNIKFTCCGYMSVKGKIIIALPYFPPGLHIQNAIAHHHIHCWRACTLLIYTVALSC